MSDIIVDLVSDDSCDGSHRTAETSDESIQLDLHLTIRVPKHKAKAASLRRQHRPAAASSASASVSQPKAGPSGLFKAKPVKKMDWRQFKDYVKNSMGGISCSKINMPYAQIRDICEAKGLNFDPDLVQYQMTAPKRQLSAAEQERQLRLGANVDKNVNRIQDFSVSSSGSIRFLVEWRDGIGCNTWQPAEYVAGCQAMYKFEKLLRESCQLEEFESGDRLRRFKRLVLSELSRKEVADEAFLRRLCGSDVFDDLDGDLLKIITFVRRQFRVWLSDDLKRPEFLTEGSIDASDSSDQSDEDRGYLNDTTHEVILRSFLKCKDLEDILQFKERRAQAAEQLLQFKEDVNRRIAEEDDMWPIRVENKIDAAVPQSFEYVADYVPSKQVSWSRQPLHSCLENCSCSRPAGDHHASETLCPCLVGFTSFPYGRNKDLKTLDPDEPIYECNTQCACITGDGSACTQKVATAKSPFHFIVFRKAEGRWAVRVKEEIPVRRFVMRYTGELLTQLEASHKYPEAVRGERLLYLDYLPDMHPRHIHVVDSRDMGNVSRYLNHSCDPNLSARAVYSGNYNVYQPRIAFFAKRTIRAGEELTFDFQTDRRVSMDDIVYQEVKAEEDYYCFNGLPEARLFPPRYTHAQLTTILSRKHKLCTCRSPVCRVYLS